MRYSGRVKNGVVIFENGAPLPEGSRVEIVPMDDETDEPSLLPAFGLWRDRPEVADPAAASLLLRGRIRRDSNQR